MTKPANIASIEKATNKSWQQWLDELEENGARELSHIELAKKIVWPALWNDRKPRMVGARHYSGL